MHLCIVRFLRGHELKHVLKVVMAWQDMQFLGEGVGEDS